jgi:hypothetical protein
MQNEICARRFHLAVSLQRTGTGGRPLLFFFAMVNPSSALGLEGIPVPF